MQAVKSVEGKEYTIADDKGPSQIVLRSKKGVFTTPAYVQQLQQAHQIFGNAAFLLQTKDGSIIIAGSETKFIIYNLSKKALLLEQDCNYIYWMSLSPGEKFLQILDKVDTNEGRSILYSLQTFKKVAIYKQNAQSNYFLKNSYPLIKFTNDDRLYFRYNSKTIEVYHHSSSQKVLRIIESGIQQFIEISKISTEHQYLITTVYLDTKTNKGLLLVFNQDKDTPIYQKNINKAEETKIKFSPTSNQFLLELQTYYDPTGKSYYGQYGLFLYNDVINKIGKVKTLQGPVHDFQWDLQGQNFLVISGFMPAEPVLFNKKNEMVFQFGKQHKNKVIWGNLGRLLCLGGFGNLNGQMDIWDMLIKKKIGSCKSNSASHCQWSPDDRKIITAILTPRLRVDNCYKVFSYTGVLLHKVNYDHTQLYETVWLKTKTFTSKDARGLSPGRKSGEQVKVEAKFMSFGASLNFDAYSNKFAEKKEEGPKLVPGQFPQQPPKKKKRRNHKNYVQKDQNLEAS